LGDFGRGSDREVIFKHVSFFSAKVLRGLGSEGGGDSLVEPKKPTQSDQNKFSKLIVVWHDSFECNKRVRLGRVRGRSGRRIETAFVN
jgi:hypothetical protein